MKTYPSHLPGKWSTLLDVEELGACVVVLQLIHVVLYKKQVMMDGVGRIDGRARRDGGNSLQASLSSDGCRDLSRIWVHVRNVLPHLAPSLFRDWKPALIHVPPVARSLGRRLRRCRRIQRCFIAFKIPRFISLLSISHSSAAVLCWVLVRGAIVDIETSPAPRMGGAARCKWVELVLILGGASSELCSYVHRKSIHKLLFSTGTRRSPEKRHRVATQR